jgi:hypothetical protein
MPEAVKGWIFALTPVESITKSAGLTILMLPVLS